MDMLIMEYFKYVDIVVPSMETYMLVTQVSKLNPFSSDGADWFELRIFFFTNQF